MVRLKMDQKNVSNIPSLILVYTIQIFQIRPVPISQNVNNNLCDTNEEHSKIKIGIYAAEI